jgi:glycosyltransferase involved in cell wall biosynthesis
MANPKHILFISHDATRTGAPIVLLHFLKWLKTHSEIPFQILLRNGGELETVFTTIAPVFVFNKNLPPERGIIPRILTRLQLKPKVHDTYLKHLRAELLQRNIGLIYANTVITGDVLKFLADLSCPVICHVHELEYGIRYCPGSEHFEDVKRYTQHYIAVSQAVKTNLIDNHNIPENKIDLIYEFIPSQGQHLPNQKEARHRICQQFGIPQESFLVCAAGTIDWRKGTDLFVQLAHTIYQQYPNNQVYFLWVGGDKEGIRFHEIWHDVRKMGLEQHMCFLGRQPNILEYFAASDVFTLVSREDPFPLVCLEAASMGKPIVCFDKAGGTKEFVEDDAGFVIPYLDIETMAAKVINILSSLKLQQRLGQRAQQKVQERYDIEVIAPKILSIIQKFLGSK